MKMIYEEINTKSTEYKKIFKQYNEIIINYQNFEEDLSFKNKATSSGKAASYRRVIVRTLALYKRIYGEVPSNINTSSFIKQMQSLLNDKEFQKFNRDHHNFYSAAINGFIKFLIFKNDNLLVEINRDKALEDYEKQHIKSHAVKKNKPYIQQLEKFPRNPMEKELTKKRTNWKCEYDSTHKTFKLPNGKQYVEAHHLIPMSAQNYFENSVDFADNMVSLCANCHRKIHLATEKERRKMIKQFYEARKEKYSEHGIKVSLTEIMKFYD